jgi:uncharacterized protein (UPF0264 family)
VTAVRRLPRGLLVSVRSIDEAVAAVAGGAAIVDVKEPLLGPLGRASADVAAAIAAAVGSRATLSLACGELNDGVDGIAAHVCRVLDRVSPGAAMPAAVKAGPAGLGLAAWRAAQAALAETVPAGIATVAVAYADPDAARSPPVEAIIREGAELGITTVLVDTFDKAGPGLFESAGEGRVAAWLDLSAGLKIELALAGRLTLADAAAAVRLGAAIVGVRSAACDEGRMGRVDRGRVARLVATLADIGCITANAAIPGDSS